MTSEASPVLPLSLTNWMLRRLTTTHLRHRDGPKAAFRRLGEVTDQLQEPNASLIAENAAFKAAMDAWPTPVFVADASGRIIYCNRVWEGYTGYPADLARGTAWLDLVRPETRQEAEREWAEAIRARRVFRTIHWFVDARGKDTPLRVDLTPVVNAGWVGVCIPWREPGRGSPVGAVEGAGAACQVSPEQPGEASG